MVGVRGRSVDCGGGVVYHSVETETKTNEINRGTILTTTSIFKEI